jgi:hypothetical protein
MRVVTMGFSAATSGRAFTIERDTVLQQMGSSQRGMVSTDPAGTIANSITGPADGAFNSLISQVNAGAPALCAFPFSAGEVIYLSISAAGIIQLFFQDS